MTAPPKFTRQQLEALLLEDTDLAALMRVHQPFTLSLSGLLPFLLQCPGLQEGQLYTLYF
jgi:hypothetical protein